MDRSGASLPLTEGDWDARFDNSTLRASVKC